MNYSISNFGIFVKKNNKLDLWPMLNIKISSRWRKCFKAKYKIVKEWGVILSEIINNIEVM